MTRFDLVDLFTATTMVALHCVVMGACYLDLDAAFETSPGCTIACLLLFMAVSWWFTNLRHRAGQPLCAALPPVWKRWQWVVFGVTHLDLIYALITLGTPFALGPMRQIGIVSALFLTREWFLILACEGGVIVRGRMHPWRRLWSSLHRYDGGWFLFINSKSGRGIRELGIAVPDEALEPLRESRARAILDEPSTRSLKLFPVRPRRVGKEPTNHPNGRE